MKSDPAGKTKVDVKLQKRYVMVGIEHQIYGDNAIRTSKYTFYNFLLLNLLEQFAKMANIYFLILSLMQIFKSISISGGQPTILLPLLFVVFVSMLKDCIEDNKRSKSDREENNSKILVHRDGDFVQDRWARLYPGELVLVQKDQFIPADLLLLLSSSAKGECFVETKNLDGETNLKTKHVPAKVRELVQDKASLKKLFSAEFYFEAPNPYLYEFSGSLNIRNTQVAVDAHNLLLRNSKLKNTEYIVGVVAFNGHYTKIMMNSVKSKRKLSEIESKISFLLLQLFFVQVVECRKGCDLRPACDSLRDMEDKQPRPSRLPEDHH